MSGECLLWQRQRLLNCISGNAQEAKLESISPGTEELKEKKNSSVSVLSSSSTDHWKKYWFACSMLVSEYIQNAQEVVSLVTFHKSKGETGRSNEQSQLPAATTAKPSRMARALWNTAGHWKILREVTKGGRGLPFMTESHPLTLMEEPWQGATAGKMRWYSI